MWPVSPPIAALPSHFVRFRCAALDRVYARSSVRPIRCARVDPRDVDRRRVLSARPFTGPAGRRIAGTIRRCLQHDQGPRPKESTGLEIFLIELAGRPLVTLGISRLARIGGRRNSRHRTALRCAGQGKENDVPARGQSVGPGGAAASRNTGSRRGHGRSGPSVFRARTA